MTTVHAFDNPACPYYCFTMSLSLYIISVFITANSTGIKSVILLSLRIIMYADCPYGYCG